MKRKDLTELVPSVELCKELPEGKFENSLLVHAERFRNGFCLDCANVIMFRAEAEESDSHSIIAPAPTLEEIVEALSDCCNVYLRKGDDGWEIMRELPGDDEWYGYDFRSKFAPDRPATAALKLWMEMTKK